MIIQTVLLIAGLLLLIKGADWLVEGASAVAKKKRVSDLAIGLTIVAFGTSAPELVVTLMASIQDQQEIVFGNIIGSNNFNLFFILGVAGLITPLVVQSSTIYKEIPISLVAAVLLFILANNFISDDTLVSRWDGIILLLLFVGFLYYVYKQLKLEPEKTEIREKELSVLKIWSFIVLGLAGLVIGGRLVVNSAVEMATAWGVSEQLIGLTIVAMGTSLPELATTVVAAVKKKTDIAVGNIIGSNIFNIFFILGVSAVVRPIPYNTIFNTDLYLLFGGTVFLFVAMFMAGKKKLDRWEAGILLAIYLLYTIYLITKEV